MKNDKMEDRATVQIITYTTTLTLSFQIKPDDYLLVDLMNLKRELPLARTPEQSREISDKKASAEIEAGKQTRERTKAYKQLSLEAEYKGQVNLMSNNYVQILKGTKFTQDNVPPYVKELADRKSHWVIVETETHTGIAK